MTSVGKYIGLSQYGDSASTNHFPHSPESSRMSDTTASHRGAGIHAGATKSDSLASGDGLLTRTPPAVWPFVLVLLAVAAFLRFYGLDRYPLPAHRDELSNAYDSWALLETGADRSGNATSYVNQAERRMRAR